MATFTDQILVMPSTGLTQKIAAGDTIELSTGTNLIIGGDLTVSGTTTTIDSANVNIEDNHLYLNKDHVSVSAETGGLVVNYLPTSANVTTSGAGVVTVPGDINITLSGETPDTLTTGMFVQVSGATLPENNGIFKVVSNNTAALLVLETTLGVDEDFLQSTMTATTDTGMTITNINLSILRAGTDGIWETATGSATGLSFDNLVTSAGASPWQTDTNVVNLVTDADTVTIGSATAGGKLFVDGDADEVQLQVQAHSTNTSDIFVVETSAGTDILQVGLSQITASQNVDATAGLDVNADSVSLTVGAGADWSVSHNGTDTTITSATGDLITDNTSATSDIILRLGTDTTATAWQIQNDSVSTLFSVLGSGQGDFVGNLDVTGGVDIDADSVALTIGAGADFSVSHDGTNTTMTSATGDLIVDNTLATGSTINRLGTDTSATDFQVQNDSASALFTVDGSGQADIPGNLDVTGGIDIDADSASLTIGASADLTIVHDGTNTTFTSTTGQLLFDNTSATSSTAFRLGTDTSLTSFIVESDSGQDLYSVNGSGSHFFNILATAGVSYEIQAIGGENWLQINNAQSRMVFGDAAVNNTFVVEGTSSTEFRLVDDVRLTFGDGDDWSMRWDEAVDGRFEIEGTSQAANTAGLPIRVLGSAGGLAGSTAAAGLGGSMELRSGNGGAAVTGASNTAGNGGLQLLQGGTGGAGFASFHDGGNGGLTRMFGGTGGLGATSQVGGVGGAILIQGGTGGQANGGTEGDGGDVTIRAGDGLTDGDLNIGLTTTSNIFMGTSTLAVNTIGGILMDERSTPASADTDTGFLYTKADGTDTELFYFSDLSGTDTEVQITKDGFLNVGSAANTEFTAAENLTAGDALYIATASTVGKSDATTADGKDFIVGIALNGPTSGNVVQLFATPGASVAIPGTIANFSAAGDVVYLSETAGGLDTNAPATSGSSIVRAGYALTATTMLLAPQFIALNP
jgi:hypothetical protein